MFRAIISPIPSRMRWNPGWGSTSS